MDSMVQRCRNYYCKFKSMKQRKVNHWLCNTELYWEIKIIVPDITAPGCHKLTVSQDWNHSQDWNVHAWPGRQSGERK